MCHCKTCTNRLHAIIVIIAIEIPYSIASCLIWFPFSHTHAFRSLLHVFDALPIVRDTSFKNAKLSSATTSFPWRHTNTSKNHGYNAVADDSCRTRNCRLLQLHFRDVTLTATRITDITLSRMTCAGSHFVPRIRHSLTTIKVKKIVQVKSFRVRTYNTVSSRPRGKCVQRLVQIGSEMWICIRYKLTNKPTFSFLYKIKALLYIL